MDTLLAYAQTAELERRRAAFEEELTRPAEELAEPGLAPSDADDCSATQVFMRAPELEVESELTDTAIAPVPVEVARAAPTGVSVNPGLERTAIGAAPQPLTGLEQTAIGAPPQPPAGPERTAIGAPPQRPGDRVDATVIGAPPQRPGARIESTAMATPPKRPSGRIDATAIATPPQPTADASEAKRADELQLGEVLGNYRLVQLVAAGGMGMVYKAEHLHLERRVAIKIMHRELSDDDEIRRRFLGEAVSIARMSHPGVVKIFDYGDVPGGLAYLIMEYLDGGNLADALEAGPLPISRALEITRQIAVTLSATHRAGIVHRDIKPENVHLVRDRYTEGDQVKLLDFGVAKFASNQFVDSVQTHMGRIIGTPLYMSPEQCLGGTVDARSDIYGLGCLLYHLVCGRPPFPGQRSDVLMAHCKQAPVRPRELRPDVPVALESMLLQMLDKVPGQRQQSMDEVVRSVRAIQHERAAKRARDHKPVTEIETEVVLPHRPSRLGHWLGLALIVLAALAV